MDLIVLSPHLDDAVFSCGGMIAKTTAAGKKAQVVTCFTGQPDPATVRRGWHRFCDYQQRKLEDQRATATLGATHVWLELTERAFRQPPLRHLRAVFATPPALSDFSSLEDLTQAIAGLLHQHPNAEIRAPLGAGNHVDHVELALAALHAMLASGTHQRFGFYEDAYAIGTHARQRHFVTQRAVWPRRLSPERAGIRAALMFRLMAHCIKGPGVETYLPAANQKLFWQNEPVPIEGHEEVKLAAVACYASQVEMLGGMKRWGRILRRYHRCWDVAEPLWRAQPAESAGS